MANELTRYIPTEMSDSEGNVRYPHTLASVTFMDDGQRVQTVLARLDHLLEDIETVTSSSEIDENTALVTAAALAEVKQLYTSLSSDISKAIGYIDYTSATDLSNIGTGATISEDGVVRLIASRYTTGNFEPILYINNAVVWTENMAPYGSCGIQSQYFPVRQGDTVKATFSGCSSGRVEFCRFRD